MRNSLHSVAVISVDFAVTESSRKLQSTKENLPFITHKDETTLPENSVSVITELFTGCLTSRKLATLFTTVFVTWTEERDSDNVYGPVHESNVQFVTMSAASRNVSPACEETTHPE